MNKLRLELWRDGREEEDFDEYFFDHLARRGVRRLKFHTLSGITIKAKAALAFGFAEPTAGGKRRLAGIELGTTTNFLSQLRKVISHDKYDRTSRKLVWTGAARQ